MVFQFSWIWFTALVEKPIGGRGWGSKRPVTNHHKVKTYRQCCCNLKNWETGGAAGGLLLHNLSRDYRDGVLGERQRNLVRARQTL